MTHRISRLRASLARRAAARARLLASLRAGAGHEDRARRQPGRHRGLAGARHRRCRWSRSTSRSTAAPPRIRPTRPGVANMIGSPARRRRRRARRQGLPGAAGAQGDRARLPRRRATTSAARCARSRENRDEAFELLRLALTAPRFDAEAVERMRAQMHGAAAARDHQPERHRQPHAGGRRPFPTIPTAGRSTARSKSLPRITRRRPARPMCAACSRATTLKIAIVGDIDAADRRRADRPRVRRAAGQGRAHAGRRRRAAGARPRASSSTLDVPQAVVTFGGPGIAPQRSGFHGRLYRQPHPRRRLVLLAALSRGAREARPRLWRLAPAWSGSSMPPCCIGGTATRADRAGETHRRSSSRSPPAGRRRPDRGRTRQGQVLSQGLLSRSASTPRPRSPASSCRSSSTISASTTSSAATA